MLKQYKLQSMWNMIFQQTRQNRYILLILSRILNICALTFIYLRAIPLVSAVLNYRKYRDFFFSQIKIILKFAAYLLHIFCKCGYKFSALFKKYIRGCTWIYAKFQTQMNIFNAIAHYFFYFSHALWKHMHEKYTTKCIL